MSVPGLCDEVCIFSFRMVGDGAGGVTQGDRISLYSRTPARLSIMSAKTQLEWFGFAGREMWHVIADPLEKLDNVGKYYLQLTPDSRPTIIRQSGIYRIVMSRHQRDQGGTIHHSSMAIELDEQVTGL